MKIFFFLIFYYFNLYIGMNSHSAISSDTIVKNIAMTILISIVEITFTFENIENICVS